jgi:osmoprotectant transport system ATP-binding protein
VTPGTPPSSTPPAVPPSPKASPHAVLRAEGVHVRYPNGVHALRGVDLVVDGGETVALVGESGSGKSTLLKIFNRLVRPSDGRVLFEGRPIDTDPPERLRRRVGYVEQNGGLLPHWTVLRNVGLVPRLLSWEETRVRRRCEALLELVGLPPAEFARRYPRSLSGGQRQRVAFARALAADPPVVLLDEPFGALDPIRRGELQAEYLRWKASLGKTTLLVTHDVPEALRLSDRIAVMRDGVIEQTASPDDLVASPATSYVHRLLEQAGVLE